MKTARCLRLALAVLVAVALLTPSLVLIIETYFILETHRDPVPQDAETQLPFPVETVGYWAADGVRLEGWYAHNPRGRAAILLLHGSDSNRLQMRFYAPWLWNAGYSLLLPDFRAHGNSGGALTSFGPREVLDAKAAVSFLASRRELDADRIGLLGVSLGAAVAVVAAAELPPVRAVVADSIYGSAEALFDRLLTPDPLLRLPFGKPGLALAGLVHGVDMRAFRPEQSAARLRPRGLFVIHGALDTGRTPVTDARAVYAAAADAPRELWIVPEAGHALAALTAPDEYRRRVTAFFHHHLGQ